MGRRTASLQHLRTCQHVTLFLLSSILWSSNAFVCPPSRARGQQAATLIRRDVLDPSSQEVGFWITAFASTHIGMSAIRGTVIEWIGENADSVGLVGNNWKLPDFWPGDSVGQNRLFFDKDTTGRQLYRALYTAISFLTLGNALYFYLQSNPAIQPESSSTTTYVAAASFAAAATSLANASPLGLMPGLETTEEGRVTRNDSVKFQARGLTRITRHPLILPVVPWGMANAIAFGGRPVDWLFFGGLSLYAICGCAAQDLRVSKQEGSVGTTFEQYDELQNFYKSTSFVPFGAIATGRQDLITTIREVPWWAAGIGWFVGNWLEGRLVELISEA